MWYFMNVSRKELAEGGLQDVLRRIVELMNRYGWSNNNIVDLVDISDDEVTGLLENGWKLVGRKYYH
jgi:hypothetical protein